MEYRNVYSPAANRDIRNSLFDSDASTAWARLGQRSDLVLPIAASLPRTRSF